MSKLIPDWPKTSLLESVFDQLSDAVVLWDPALRIVGVNRSAERLLGMSSEEMLGKHLLGVTRDTLRYKKKKFDLE